MTQWIDKRPTLIVKEGLRTDKVVAHFTENGLYQLSQDGVSRQSLPSADVYVLGTPGTVDIQPRQNGAALCLNTPNQVALNLPSSSLGKMRYEIGSIYSGSQVSPHVLVPKATDRLYVRGLMKQQGEQVFFGTSTAELSAASMTAMSDGKVGWYLIHTVGLAVPGAAPVTFPTTPVLDDFNRPDENPLSGAGKWAHAIGRFESPLKLVVNRAQISVGGNENGSYWTQPFSGTALEMYATVPSIPPPGNDGFAYMGLFSSNPGISYITGYELYLYVSGTNNRWWFEMNYYSGGPTVTVATIYVPPFVAGESFGMGRTPDGFWSVYRKTLGAWQQVVTVFNEPLVGPFYPILALYGIWQFENFGGGAV